MYSQYAGKPLVYLDHNILDLFVKKGITPAWAEVTAINQVTYSETTLEEIKNSVGFENQFLAILDKLNAIYIQHYPESSAEQGGQVKLLDGSAFHHFKEHVDASDYNYLTESMTQFQFKLAGGRKGENVSKVLNEQRNAAAKLGDNFQNLVDGLQPEEFSEAAALGISRETLFSLSAMVGEGLNLAINQLEKTIVKNHPQTENWNSIEDFRNALKVGPSRLNNLKPPKIIEQIWELVKKPISMSIEVHSVDEFLELVLNPSNPEKPLEMNKKAAVLYNFLNSLGYWADSKQNQENPFKATLKDNNHVMWACFTNALITADERLAKKASAVYEYLGIKTDVIYVPR